jgi:hypothetical protein
LQISDFFFFLLLLIPLFPFIICLSVIIIYLNSYSTSLSLASLSYPAYITTFLLWYPPIFTYTVIPSSNHVRYKKRSVLVLVSLLSCSKHFVGILSGILVLASICTHSYSFSHPMHLSHILLDSIP